MCFPGAVSEKALELSTPPEAIWAARASALQGNCLHPQPLVPWGSSFQVRVKTHQQGCAKEAAALIRGVLWVSGACQSRQTVAGTLHQRARQTGLGGKILASRGYRCSLARRQQKIPAGWFLPAEGNLGRRKAKPPPFSTLCPIPAPASPTARKRRGGGQNSSHQIRLERSHGTAQPKHKGEDKPKINTHAHRRTHACTHTAFASGEAEGKAAVGGWLGGEEKFHAGLFKGVLFVQGCPNICGALAGPECVQELRQRVLGVGKLCSPQPLQACSPSGSDSIKPAPEIY